MYWWTYVQDRNRDADIENRFVDKVGEGEGGANWESNTEAYTIPCVKEIATGKLLYNTGTSTQCSVMI